MKQMKIIKRSGEEKEFDISKIENAIRKASQAVDYKCALSEGRIKLIAEEVAGVCEARDRAMTVEEIQDVVETKIMEMGAHEVAKKYITYRYKQNLLSGMFVSRRVYIDGSVPFEEANYCNFNFSEDWEVRNLGNGDTDYQFYLSEGKHVKRLEVVLSDEVIE